jgi:DNA-binding NarL/FixJ family response regulator
METIDVGVYDENAIFAYGVVAVLRDDPLVGRVTLDVADAPTVSVAVASVGMIGTVALDCPIVACVTSGEATLSDADELGVVALLDRDRISPDQLCSAIHAAAAGLRIRWESSPGIGVLDDRSREVLRMLAAGAGTREISLELGYSERTIKATIHQLQHQLGARSRAHAVAVAMRSALI